MIRFLTLVQSILVILALSCTPRTQEVAPNAELHISLEVENSISIKSARTEDISTDDFRISILDENDNLLLVYPRYSDMPPAIPLNPGSYKVKTELGSDQVVSWDQPYMSGETEVFTLVGGEQKAVVVEARFQSAMINVFYDDLVTANFTTYQTNVSNNDGALLYNETETRTGYFSLEPITINAILGVDNGSGIVEYSISGSIDNPAPNTLYEVTIHGFEPSGSASIDIQIADISDTVIVDLDVPEEPSSIGYGELLITEVMSNPDALSDADGEWFEIYNASDHDISLQNVILKKASGSAHVISDNITISSGQFFGLAKTDAAFSGSKYVYSGISLSNSGDNIGLYNYGTDGTNGSLICELTYDGSFPTSAGAAMQLSSASLDISLIDDPAHWCLATNAYDTGDLGSPANGNSSCP